VRTLNGAFPVRELRRLVVVFASLCFGAGTGAGEDLKPELLPKELVAAWAKAGGTVGWLQKESFFWNFTPHQRQPGAFGVPPRVDGEPGELPAFRFSTEKWTWKPGAIGKLPSPDRPFGLALSGPIMQANLAELATHKHLKYLDLQEETLTDDALKGLTDMKQLEWLNLGVSSKVTNAGLKHLVGLPNLHYLRVPSEITNDGLGEIRKMKQLRKLDLHGCHDISDLGVVVGITELTELQDLTLDSDQITDFGFSALTSLDKLRRLELRDVSVTEEGLKQLAKFKQLESLTLRGTETTDAVLKEIAGLKHLRKLWIPSQKITDAGLKEIVALERLEILMLSSTRVTDAGLKHLAGLKQLKQLDLRGTAVTDAGLPHILQMEKLTRLDLTKTKVTPEGVKLLKKALPQLKVYGP
jgi:Leucine-rich repeat (LRR) protein